MKCWILCIFHIMLHFRKQEIDSFLAGFTSLPDVPISMTVTAEDWGSDFYFFPPRKHQI